MPRAEAIAMLALLAVAAFLRFTGLGWDQGFLLHPDERNLVSAAARLSLVELRDPGFYAYNGFALYVDRILGAGLAAWRGDPALATDPAALARIGRAVSALASTATVALTYGLARQTLGRRPAWLAACLLALAPGAIQAAHFATTESLLVMWGVGCAWASARIAVSSVVRVADVLLAAVCAGLAIGTKTAGLAYLLMPAMALLPALPQQPARTVASGVGVLALAGLLAMAVSPHSVLALDAFLLSMASERAIASGADPVFYTQSFVGTLPWLHPFGSLHWLAGPLVPALGFAGLMALVATSREVAFRGLLPLAVFGFAYFAYVGSWHAKFVRYMLPLLPALAIGAAAVCERAGSWRRVVGLALVASTALWGAAFFSIYLRPDTRLEASRWLAAEARTGDVVALERRDVVLPLLQPRAASGLETSWLDGFAPDSDATLEQASEALARADWLVLTSRRVHGVTRAYPEQFPRTSALYRLLFDAGLGYQLAARFESQPSLVGLTLPDDAAEETFRVFDHPTVLVFRNQRRLAPSEIQRAILREAAIEAEG